MNKELIAILVLAAFSLVGYLVWRVIFRETGRFDRVISGGLGRQMGLLGAIVGYILIACFVAFAVACYPSINKELDFWDKMGAVFHRFFGYNYYEEDGTGLNWLLLFISITGTLVMTGLLVTTFSNILQQRKADARRGEIHYRNLPQGHAVIIGYGSLCQPILERLLAADKASYVVIQTSQPVERVRREIHSKLSPADEKRVIFYSGDMHSLEHLACLQLNQAREVYILGENEKAGRDAANLECARLICSLLDATGEPLPVHVRLDRPTAYSTVKRLSFPTSYYQKDGKTVIYLRPFNFYENCARSVWGYLPGRSDAAEKGRWQWPLLKEDDPRHIQIVIAGFGKMGKAMLLEAIRICHFPNFNEKTGANKTRISVVDSEMDRLKDEFRAQYPELDKLSDIELDYRAIRLEDPSFRKQIAAWAADANTLLTVVVCFSDPDRSLSAGINLPSALYFEADAKGLRMRDNVHILVRQQVLSGHGIESLLKGNDWDYRKYHNVHAFGHLSEGTAPELFDDRRAMWAGAYYDVMWPDDAVYPEKAAVVKELRTRYPELETESVLDFARTHFDEAYDTVRKLWYLTNEDLRFANRYQVDMYGIFAMYEGKVAPQALWRMEHLRWCADRLIAGYSPFPLTDAERKAFQPAFKTVKPLFQIHNLLVPFSALPESERDKDETVINNRKAIEALVTGHKQA